MPILPILAVSAASLVVFLVSPWVPFLGRTRVADELFQAAAAAVGIVGVLLVFALMLAGAR